MEGGNDCDPVNGICTNTEGGFTCSCKSGYRVNGNFCSSELM